MANKKPPVYYIDRLAPKYGLDPGAVKAVAMGEGGLRWGAVGDQGTSFGPFQLHIGGASPYKNPKQAAAFANSPQGIDYALRKMAESGAAGLRGAQAVDAIVRKFERPANPDASVRNAIARLSQTGGVRGVATRQTSRRGPSPGLRKVRGAFQKALQLALTGDVEQAWRALAVGTGRLAQFKPAAAQRPPGPRMTGGFAAPLPTPFGGGSEFGVRDPEGAPGPGGRYHAAKDWFAPAGTPLRSPWDGKVVEVKASRGNSGQVYGGVVKIMRPSGQVFVARHVDPRGIRPGMIVRAGQPIATVSPWTNGAPHAHVELWKTLRGGYTLGNMIDPATVFAR